MRDVPLVPERNVLEPDRGGRAHDPRKPADTFGDLRIAFVRHCRRPLHPARERLLDLAHLSASEVADLRGETVEGARKQRERRKQLGVPVTRDHLGRERIGLETEALARDSLDLRVQSGVGPDRARELSHTIGLQRSDEPSAAAVELEGPAGELPAERHRLGMDPVGTTDADRETVGLGLREDGRERAIDAGKQEPSGGGDLEESAVSTTSEDVSP